MLRYVVGRVAVPRNNARCCAQALYSRKERDRSGARHPLLGDTGYQGLLDKNERQNNIYLTFQLGLKLKINDYNKKKKMKSHLLVNHQEPSK